MTDETGSIKLSSPKDRDYRETELLPLNAEWEGVEKTKPDCPRNCVVKDQVEIHKCGNMRNHCWV